MLLIKGIDIETVLVGVGGSDFLLKQVVRIYVFDLIMRFM